MMKRIISILTMVAVSLCALAQQDDYHKFITNYSRYGSATLKEKADSLAAAGRDEDATMLYMIVTARPEKGASVEELKTHIESYLKTGDICFAKGEYAYALRNYISGLKLSEQMKDRPFLPLLYKNIGNVYVMYLDYEKGKAVYMRGLSAAREAGDDQTAYQLLLNLATVNIELGDIETARRDFTQARATRHAKDDEAAYMDCYISTLLLRQTGQNERCIPLLKSLARMAEENSLEPRFRCHAYQELADIFKSENNTDSALYYLDLCTRTASENNILHQYLIPLKSQYTLYEKKGDRAMAARLKDLYLQISDSIYNQRQFDMAKNHHFLYELDRYETELSELNEHNERRASEISRLRIIIGCAVGALLLILAFAFYIYRQKRRLNASYRTLYEMHQEKLSAVRESQAGRESRTSGEDAAGADVPAEDVSADDSDKYQNSSLTSVHKESLAREISRVMEDQHPFCSPDFSLNALAGLVGSNSKYVSQVINDVFKKNFSTFVNEYRVNLACEMLTDSERFGNYSIRGIGNSVGFRLNGTFTSVFKKITGITPSTYQKMALEKQNES